MHVNHWIYSYLIYCSSWSLKVNHKTCGLISDTIHVNKLARFTLLMGSSALWASNSWLSILPFFDMIFPSIFKWCLCFYSSPRRSLLWSQSFSSCNPSKDEINRAHIFFPYQARKSLFVLMLVRIFFLTKWSLYKMAIPRYLYLVPYCLSRSHRIAIKLSPTKCGSHNLFSLCIFVSMVLCLSLTLSISLCLSSSVLSKSLGYLAF